MTRMSSVGFKHLFCAALFSFAVSLCISPAAYCSIKKISSDTQGGVGGITPIPDHRAEITLSPTDSAVRDISRNLSGQFFDAETGTPSRNIDANTITLSCGAATVRVLHGQITVSKDQNSNLDNFNYTPFTFDQTDISNIVPSIATNPVWCQMNIPQSGGSTWHFPNAFRLDEQNPDVTTAANFFSYPIIGLPDGAGRWPYAYGDPFTPGDPDGNVETCTEPKDHCNKSDTRYQYQFYSKKKTDADWPLAPAAHNDPSNMTVDVPGPAITGDRFLVTDDTKQYCYTIRVEDTAGNFSNKATGADVKCFVPDGKRPVFNAVKFYSDPAMAVEFPHDGAGNYTVTSNPCYFDPVGCNQGVQRYIYLQLVFSEPLFDGQFWGGYTSQANDLLDNDADLAADEETGGFNGLDDDGDGFVDEDVSIAGCVPTAPAVDDGIDNDCDGYVDEVPGAVPGADSTNQSCISGQIWNYAQKTCMPLPRISIQGGDIQGVVPGPNGTDNHNSDVTWLCTSWPGNVNALCNGLPTGTTIYKYKWEVTGPQPPVGLIEGPYDITMSQGADAVGNVFATPTVPVAGGSVNLDNTGPQVELAYYANNTFTTGVYTADHDGSEETANPCGAGSLETPRMPIAKAQKLYIRLTMTEMSGATPTVTIYGPNNATPAKYDYCGIPQDAPADVFEIPAYTTCGQDISCDPCTGQNCQPYDYRTTPCSVFRACFDVASSTINNGFASIGIWARDRLENMVWNPDNAHALASQHSLNGGNSDDFNHDGRPTLIPAVAEPGATETVTLGQYFAVDTVPPPAPTLSLPITPCDNEVARTGITCSTSAQTSKSPILTWTRLSNHIDDDGDTVKDEEAYDGVDNDGDGMIDEDAFAPATGTFAWEIKGWYLQVNTDSSFATATMVYDHEVPQANYMLTNLLERATETPYFWRVGAYDNAGNLGPWSPPAEPFHPPYYTFGIDITPPQMAVQYFSDNTRTTPLARNDNNVPVTKDTASEHKKIYVTLTSNEPVPNDVTFKLRQQGSVKIADSATRNPLDPLQFFGEFEVNAIGGGQLFTDGLVDFLVSVKDRAGNALVDQLPATGTQFYVDTIAPFVNPGDISAEPNPASLDNNGNGIPGELIDDRVTIKVKASEFLKRPFNIRVRQANFPDVPVVDDGIDNDCDGRVDEELLNGMDDDGDGLIDEDTGTHGQIPGTGCLIDMERDGEVPGAYIGYYNVFDGHDGQAQIVIGSTDTVHPNYWVANYAGLALFASGSFTVDTIAPDPPSLVLPLHEQHVADNTPVLGWQVQNRTPDLFKYRIQVADNAGFASPAVDVYSNDDQMSTTFYYTVPAPLTDAKYFWRVYTIDKAQNRSVPSVTSIFYVDTLPPAAPKFDSVQTPTVERTSPLSGTAEANSSVEIYNNTVLLGEVKTDATGVFSVGIDDDKDGQIDEDPVDGVDNDLDGLVDEDPPGIFLSEGDNIIEGRVIDSAGNFGTRGCDPTTPVPFYDAAQGKCIIVLDSGAPTFKILYFSDSALTTPLPFNTNTNKFVANPSTIYLKVIASEDLPTPPTYSLNQQGTTDITNALTSSINGSLRQYVGTYTVHVEMPNTYLDGDAQVIAIGADAQGNRTPAGTLPSVGAVFTIDSKTSNYDVSYYKDARFSEDLNKDQNLIPDAKAGPVYMRIVASEPQATAPKISIDQQGTTDTVEQPTTAVHSTAGTSTVSFTYVYNVTPKDGSAFKDGSASISMHGTDLAGNSRVGIEPTRGDTFIIDTTAPVSPTLTLPASTTIYTQLTATGTTEPYSLVDVFVRGNQPMTIDDNVDNDNDGRVDEEPVDGVDNDNDGFIDEDTTSHSCSGLHYWDKASASCVSAPVDPPAPNGSAQAGTSGDYSVIITSIGPGKNLVYTRATDFAGNVSALSSPGYDLINLAPQNITIEHTFPAGWNLVGIPLQPTITNPHTAFNIPYDIYRLQSGVYRTGAYISPMEPGMCYWANLPDNGTTIRLTGITSTTQMVRLAVGWNMVALPYDNDTPWNSTVKVKVGVDSFDLGSANANDALDPYVYFYDNSTGAFSTRKGITDNITLHPWEGFLVKAKKISYLVFPLH